MVGGSMRITILGSGTSTGVPEIGCTCPVCMSKDSRDDRMRCSALIETREERILIDCGPDFRRQMLGIPYAPIHAVLLTHEHYDHVGGIDDLRPFCRQGDVPLYAEQEVAAHIRHRIPYCFAAQKYPGVPRVTMNEIEAFRSFRIGNTEILPIQVMHGKLPILGYRIGRMAYITDMLTMPTESYDVLQGVDCLIMNALRIEPHNTHQSLEQALENRSRIAPKECYFIHMSHGLGLHSHVEATLPSHVHLAYDGLQIEI